MFILNDFYCTRIYKLLLKTGRTSDFVQKHRLLWSADYRQILFNTEVLFYKIHVDCVFVQQIMLANSQQKCKLRFFV